MSSPLRGSANTPTASEASNSLPRERVPWDGWLAQLVGQLRSLPGNWSRRLSCANGVGPRPFPSCCGAVDMMPLLLVSPPTAGSHSPTLCMVVRWCRVSPGAELDLEGRCCRTTRGRGRCCRTTRGRLMVLGGTDRSLHIRWVAATRESQCLPLLLSVHVP